MKKYRENIIEYLKEIFQQPKIELNYSTEFELLIAVILSAQCTDKRVNMVTNNLFQKYNTPTQFANIELFELEQLIKPCGFYRNKAKAIIEMSKMLLENYDGLVPHNKEELMKLRGVGRKTANVLLSCLTNIPAFAVDTHVFRVSKRLGISSANNVLQCEKDLMKYFEEKDWSELHYLFVLFGRYQCLARKPKCYDCKFSSFCKYKNELSNVNK